MTARLQVVEGGEVRPPRAPVNRIVIGYPLKSVSQCAACAPFRDRYREKMVPIKLLDTGETIVLGVTCLGRIFERIMADKRIAHRKLSGNIGRMRRVLIIDLSAKYSALGLRKGDRNDEKDFVRRKDAQDDLQVTPNELRMYLLQDIHEREQEARNR
jgi:hypothetical protein